MEPITFSSLIYFLTSLFLLLLSLQVLRKHASKSELPPGPSTLPIIGSLHHIATSNLPHRIFRDLAMLHGPVMFLRAGETNLIVISSREAAREVLQTQDANCANRPTFNATNAFFYDNTDIAFSNGPYWHQVRRLCNSELLSQKQVRLFSSIRKEEINSMLKGFRVASGKTPINLSLITNDLANNIICRAAFGERCKNRGAFFEILHEVTELLSCFQLSDYFPSLSWLDVKMRTKIAKAHRYH